MCVCSRPVRDDTTDAGEDNSKNNLTNVYRIFSAVRQGKVDGDNVLQVGSNPEKVVYQALTSQQKKQYWLGPGTKSNPIIKTASGIWGLGCEQIIQEVYKVKQPPWLGDAWLIPYSTAAFNQLATTSRSSSLVSVAAHVSRWLDCRVTTQ
jgi:hypothetical protein